MGMFDYVNCEYGLPDKEAQRIQFQTKDFACLMSEFVITKEGRLVNKHWGYGETPKEELRYPDAPEGTLQSVCGIVRREEGSDQYVDMDYHGDLYIYGGEEPYMTHWFEYVVRFTEGTVSSVRRVGEEETT